MLSNNNYNEDRMNTNNNRNEVVAKEEQRINMQKKFKK